MAQAQAVWLIIMTPKQADVWQAYHQASEMLADATETLLGLRKQQRDGLIGNCAEQEDIVLGLLANYRACRAAMEALS